MENHRLILKDLVHVDQYIDSIISSKDVSTIHFAAKMCKGMLRESIEREKTRKRKHD